MKKLIKKALPKTVVANGGLVWCKCANASKATCNQVGMGSTAVSAANQKQNRL